MPSQPYGWLVVDVWEVRDRALHHSSVDVADAAAIAADVGTVVWAQATPEEMVQLGPALNLHPRAVEEIVQHADSDNLALQRTKLERFPHSTLLYLYRSHLEADGTLHLIDSPVIVTREAMITVQRDEPLDKDALIARWDRNPQVLDYGVPALLWAVLDLVVDTHLDVLDGLSESVDDMEGELFDSDPRRDDDPRETQMRAFATRKALVQLRRAAQPMREVVTGLMRYEESAPRSSVDAGMQPYYQDVYDHVLRVNDSVEGLRDLIATIYETRLALNDHSLNTVTRQLAAWAAIIAVPTAVTGFYGQNIPYPGFARPSGFWTSTIIWVGLSVVLYFAFRKRKWL
jgi:magnesium transporter